MKQQMNNKSTLNAGVVTSNTSTESATSCPEEFTALNMLVDAGA
ncbi:hypothetical protein [Ornithinibacillus sp. 179-J 7C1 HS]